MTFTEEKLVFQIGMHKTATCALNYAFDQLGLPSYHVQPNRLPYVWPKLANGEPWQHYRAFTDFLWIHSQEEYATACERVRALKELYPNARFILNTRQVDDWIQSHVTNNARHKIALESVPELCALKQRWYAWHAFVLELFLEQPERLLCFDVERDSFQRVIDFLELKADKPLQHYWQRVYVTPSDIKQALPQHSWWCSK